MKTVDITVAQFLDALKKNGYPWAQGAMLYDYGDLAGYSCAMGQAARNLIPDDADRVADGVTNFGYALVEGLNKIDGNAWLGQHIMKKNDNDAQNYDEVVTYAEEILAPYHDVTMHINYNTEEDFA